MSNNALQKHGSYFENKKINDMDIIQRNKVFKTLGAINNNSRYEREEHDYYATNPNALERLLNKRDFAHNIWECCCGGGHLSKVLKQRGYEVYSTDIISRGEEDDICDFLTCNRMWDGDIITNPPYTNALQFVKKALSLIRDGNRVCMLLRIQFLEGKQRQEFFKEFPPKEIWVSVSRIMCAKGGVFSKFGGNSAICYAWFVWEKGWTGDPVVKWFND